MTAIDLITHPTETGRISVPIRTSRLQLRPFTEGDIGCLGRILADPETTQWIGGTKTEAEAAASVLRMRDSFNSRGWGTLAVLPIGESQSVGYCGVRPLPHTQDVELAFGFLKSHWGHGFATEASIACLDAAFAVLPLQSIVATVYPGNSRSLAVLKKLKMRQEATVFGQWPHSLALLFRVTKDEWTQRGRS
jgi:[ribosomal protein S5]-alanine N-acetyltransferase